MFYEGDVFMRFIKKIFIFLFCCTAIINLSGANWGLFSLLWDKTKSRSNSTLEKQNKKLLSALHAYLRLGSRSQR